MTKRERDRAPVIPRNLTVQLIYFLSTVQLSSKSEGRALTCGVEIGSVGLGKQRINEERQGGRTEMGQI